MPPACDARAVHIKPANGLSCAWNRAVLPHTRDHMPDCGTTYSARNAKYLKTTQARLAKKIIIAALTRPRPREVNERSGAPCGAFGLYASASPGWVLRASERVARVVPDTPSSKYGCPRRGMNRTAGKRSEGSLRPGRATRTNALRREGCPAEFNEFALCRSNPGCRRLHF